MRRNKLSIPPRCPSRQKVNRKDQFQQLLQKIRSY